MSIDPHDLEEFSNELPPVEAIIAAEQSRMKRGRGAAHLIAKFLFGQGATQSINVLANLFLVRALSIEAYAQFGLAIAFQTVFSVLMDLGFASTIVPLIGDRRDDAALVGRYVRSARHLRDRMFWYLAPVAAISFFAIMHRHHWSMGLQIMLVASVLLSLYGAGKVSYFSAPLFVFSRLKEYYVPQVLAGTGRLIAYVAISFTRGLNAWVAAGLSAINVIVNGTFIGKASRKYFEWPEKESTETDRELLQYILPASPAIIFSAFQTQISLFLIGIFGGTIYIAEVAALSRIGQMFAVLMTFNTIVVEPYIARLERSKLLRTFIEVVFTASLACVPLALVAFLWPDVFIWVLGAKYKGVQEVMGWYILSCCMNFVAGTIWIMNRARKWVFWSGSILEVGLLLVVQIAFLISVGVRTTREAVLFSLASSFCYLIAHIYVTVYGFIKGPRASRI